MDANPSLLWTTLKFMHVDDATTKVNNDNDHNTTWTFFIEKYIKDT